MIRGGEMTGLGNLCGKPDSGLLHRLPIPDWSKISKSYFGTEKEKKKGRKCKFGLALV